MLRKLMKYELQATARLMLPLYLVVLLLAVGARFATMFLDATLDLPTVLDGVLQFISVLVVIGFVLGLIAAFAAAFVLMIVRFSSNLLGDEGYVMFTLPVSDHQLVWAKLLVSTLWFLGAAVVDVLAGLLLVVDHVFFADLNTLFRILMEKFGGTYLAQGGLFAAEGLVLVIVASFALCLTFYTPLSIGHSFGKHKMLLSVAFFCVIQIGVDIVSTVLLVAVSLALDSVADFLSAQTPVTFAHYAMWTAILGAALYGAVLYIINHIMLRKRLNLE